MSSQIFSHFQRILQTVLIRVILNYLPGGVLDGGAMIILNGMVVFQVRRRNLFAKVIL